MVATAFALAYGLCQLICGALGDRFGKYRLVALMTLVSALDRGQRGLRRFARGCSAWRASSRGATAAAIVPLGDGLRRRPRALPRAPGGARALPDRHHLRPGRRPDPGRRARRAGRLARGLPAARRPVPAGRPAARARAALAARAAAAAHRLDQPGRAAARLRAAVRPLLGARDRGATVFVEGFLFYGAFAFIGAWLRDALRPRLRDHRPRARLPSASAAWSMR